ncbi:MAG: AraC family transcriptional regulator [Chitinophagaceae bacterium]|nr:MAG: AraC family transcriptional regulator [Chitinophagaceae bacterium]
MIYLKFQPCSELLPFVECYFVWSSDAGVVEHMVVESPPNGFCSIVFNSGDPYYLQNKKYEKLEVPKEFAAGQAIYSYKLFLHGHISIAGIVFRPAALATLFDMPVYQYTEERIDLRKVLLPAVVERYASQIADAEEPAQKAKLLEEFVLKYYHANKPVPDFIDEAANKIVASHGILNVGELMDNIYMSRRNFERRFFRKVGLSPKYYARVRRIGYALNLASGKKKIDWSSIFSECEYYDQSHFIKDFLEFTGRTPQQYLEENKELANLVDKPKEQPLR